MSQSARGWVRVIVAAALLGGTALFLHSRSQAEILPPREPLSSFPTKLGSWQGANVVIPDWALRVLGHGEFVERTFARNQTEPSVDLFIAYFPSQRSGSTVHSPQNCLPGSGWTPVESSRVELPRPDGGTMRVNRYIVARGMNRLLVYYWYQAQGRVIASEYWAKFYLVEDSIRLNRSDGALVRVSTGIAEGESVTDAERRGLAFTQEVLPTLDRFIPR